jgi:hypothetical protein
MTPEMTRGVRALALLTAALVCAVAAAAVKGAVDPAGIAIGDIDGDGDVDLDDLMVRIGESKAIGWMTKLTLKRDIDGFQGELRQFHEGRSKLTLDQLHERYDVLVYKLLALVQDKDPALARDIASSRDPLWAQLSDPAGFGRLRGSST